MEPGDRCGSDAQAWAVDGGRLVSVGSGKCLDAPGAGPPDDARLRIWDRTGGSGQQWTVH